MGSIANDPAFQSQIDSFSRLAEDERQRRISDALPSFRQELMRLLGGSRKRAAADRMAVLALGNDRALSNALVEVVLQAKEADRVDAPLWAQVVDYSADHGISEGETIRAIWQQTFQNTPALMQGMKAVDVFPRWIEVNTRLARRIREVIETRGWRSELQEELEDYFSDLMDLATSTPPLQELPKS